MHVHVPLSLYFLLFITILELFLYFFSFIVWPREGALSHSLSTSHSPLTSVTCTSVLSM